MGRAVIACSTKSFVGMIYLKVTSSVTAASLQLADVSFSMIYTSLSLMTLKMLATRSFSFEMLSIKGSIVCSTTNCFTLGFLCVEAI